MLNTIHFQKHVLDVGEIIVLWVFNECVGSHFANILNNEGHFISKTFGRNRNSYSFFIRGQRELYLPISDVMAMLMSSFCNSKYKKI